MRSRIFLLSASVGGVSGPVTSRMRLHHSIASGTNIFHRIVALNHDGTVKYLAPQQALSTVSFAHFSTGCTGTTLTSTCHHVASKLNSMLYVLGCLVHGFLLSFLVGIWLVGWSNNKKSWLLAY